jgi:hypothetical protein
MIPEPTTAATKNPVPTNSAVIRRSGAIDSSLLPDAIDFFFDRQFVQASER